MNKMMRNYIEYFGEKCFGDIYAIPRFIEGAKNELHNIVEDIKRNDIIFFGDSLLNYADPNEDQTSVSRYFSKFSKGNIFNFSAGSFSFLNFNRFFFHYYSEFKEALKGKLILFEINPRSFSDEWFLRPSYKFEHIEGFLTADLHLVTKEIFTDSLNKKTENFYNYPLNSDIINYNQFSRCRIIRDVFNYFKANPKIYSQQFDFYYGYSLSRLKIRFYELQRTLSFFSDFKNLTKVYFWICPLNYRYISDSLSQTINCNLEYIKDSILKEGFSCLDLSKAMTNYELFLDKEHLRSEGRKLLALKLSEAVKNNLYLTLNSSVTHYTGGFFRQIEPIQFRKYAQIYNNYLKENESGK